MTDTIRSSRRYTGDVAFSKAPSVPDGSYYDQAINDNADISAGKVRHQFPDVYAIGSTVNMTTGGEQLGHIVFGSTGAVYAVEAMVHALPTTAGTLSVDYQKCTAATTYVSVLSAPISIASSDTIRTAYSGTVTTGEYSAGAQFRWVWGTTGASASTDVAKGLVATAWHRQAPA